MRHVGGHERQIGRPVFPDVITDESPTFAVQRQGKLVFRMVVPLERDLRYTSVVDANRAALRKCNRFELRLHSVASFRRPIAVFRYWPNCISSWLFCITH